MIHEDDNGDIEFVTKSTQTEYGQSKRLDTYSIEDKKIFFELLEADFPPTQFRKFVDNYTLYEFRRQMQNAYSKWGINMFLSEKQFDFAKTLVEQYNKTPMESEGPIDYEKQIMSVHSVKVEFLEAMIAEQNKSDCGYVSISAVKSANPDLVDRFCEATKIPNKDVDTFILGFTKLKDTPRGYNVYKLSGSFTDDNYIVKRNSK